TQFMSNALKRIARVTGAMLSAGPAPALAGR
ncbi:MAG: hypothetical protein QOE37_155, partial [Microbacteriaceae bacterium]|nr:hypothetical protein [Microbacteriaceae bacterium]